MNKEFNSIHQKKTPDFTIDENAVDSSPLKNREENFNDIEIRINSKNQLAPPTSKFHLKKCSTMEYTLTPITEISINLGEARLNGTPPSSRSFSNGKFFYLCQMTICFVIFLSKKQTTLNLFVRTFAFHR